MQRLKQLCLPVLVLLAISGLAMSFAPTAQRKLTTVHAAAPRLQREVFGFALASSLADPSVGYPSWNFSLLSTVAFFGLHINDDGSFTGDDNWTIWNNTAERTAFVNAAHAAGTRVLLGIVLQDFSPNTPHMCSALAHWEATVGYVAAQVKAQGVDGVNVDYEGLNGSCGTSDPSWARRAMTSFAGTMRAALPAGSYLSVDTYASSAADPIGFFDVTAMAPSVDSFFVMAYDLEYSNYTHPPLSCASFCLGPTAPLAGYYYNDTSTASQYISAVGAGKVILGVPYYGRKACVASAGPNQQPSSSVVADGYLDAVGEASYFEVKPGTYVAHRDANDPAGQERWDTWYNTGLGCTRELYFDDSTSLGLKYNLVNQDNLRGVGIWTLNYGGGAPELWSQLALHFSLVPSAPGNLSVCAGATSASVSWSPATSKAGPITGYQVTASPGGQTVTVPGNVSAAVLTGLAAGTAYTLQVQAINSAGTGIAASSASVTPVAAAVYTGYFSWFDTATPGMEADNIHLLNTGAAPDTGCLQLSGQYVVPFSLNAGQESYLTFPRGSIGGPVTVTVSSGPAVLASQRVQYFQSFNEVWAMTPAQAATTSYINWFDRITPGMVADNIHVLNPGSAAANVTVSLPGASPIVFTLAPSQETYVSFRPGLIGGPISVTSNQPVLASQRVQYYSSFNEVVARSAAQAATTSYFQWFDRASAGMVADNIHLVNPGTSPAKVTVSLPGAPSDIVTLSPGQETYVSFTAGHINGPVTVASTVPVLASQRVQYFQSFNEVPQLLPSQAATVSHVMWFDRATPGMVSDNIHLLNPGTTAAAVTVSMPGASNVVFNLAAGNEIYISFPPGHIGGPVTITSTLPILAAQRVQYFESFNEISAM